MPRISQIFRHMALSTSSITHQEELPLMESRKQKIISQLADDLLQLFSCLPDEIIIEILLRLPVKSLLKLRCVSKSWLSVLSSPQFINTQIKFSAKESKNVNLRLVVVASVSGLGRMCSIYSIVCGNSSLNVVKIDYPLKAPLGSAKILGSCNGLICLTAASCKLILWNPATGKYNEFQDSFVHGGGGCFIRYGFGYDELTDDYKVVKMFSYRRDEGKHENMVKVYSSRANSWTMIEGFNSGYINGQLGLFVNGTLHWDVCHNRDLNGSWEIMTFNLVTNMFGVMALPSCGKGNCSWTLSASGGHLVACCNYDSDKTDLWVMKEYGVENSWTKSVSLTSPVDRRGHISPLFVSENGDEVIVKLGTYISLYNSKNASYYALENHPSGYCLQVQAVTYIESLASPDVC